MWAAPKQRGRTTVHPIKAMSARAESRAKKRSPNYLLMPQIMAHSQTAANTPTKTIPPSSDVLWGRAVVSGFTVALHVAVIISVGERCQPKGRERWGRGREERPTFGL